MILIPRDKEGGGDEGRECRILTKRKPSTPALVASSPHILRIIIQLLYYNLIIS